ncbi:MAG: lysozyme [Streptosporangiaceae bacterium]|nr:lysozyme [Streptosporangiaceae bacterium]MBV9858307.1 lysozyme [Streptosporangiaceae bacterium]
MLKHPPHAAMTRRIVPVAGVAATLLIAGAIAGTSASAATAGPRAATTAAPHIAPRTWAYDPVTGKKVTVYKPAGSTPVRPEKLTHPQRDDMGLVTAAHTKKHAGMTPAAAVSGLPGIDVSAYQGNINWAAVAPHIDFVYAKATEGTYYTNPYFTNQYVGPYDYGLIRGAYHFAIPNNSSGAAQADYFAHHGGGWSADGKTLPGALDIEYNPYGNECYNLTHSQMTAWIKAFVNEYAYDEHVYPVIYSTFDWWNTCTGNASGFQNNDPLWIACYCSSAGTLPAGYGYYTFWQYADSGSLPGDQDVFNGSYSRLQALARG